MVLKLQLNRMMPFPTNRRPTRILPPSSAKAILIRKVNKPCKKFLTTTTHLSRSNRSMTIWRLRKTRLMHKRPKYQQRILIKDRLVKQAESQITTPNQLILCKSRSSSSSCSFSPSYSTRLKPLFRKLLQSASSIRSSQRRCSRLPNSRTADNSINSISGFISMSKESLKVMTNI